MYKLFSKNLLDFTLSIILLPLLLILFIPLSLFIFFEDKGPVFYISTRVKKDGYYFKMIKFRTMKVDSLDVRNRDGSTIIVKNDTRFTKIGKIIREYSIDELPQLINIFLGDMSFVGPRPDLPVPNNKIILKVKPGITGYSQAYYRNNIKYNDKIKLDIFYQENISFFLDFKIVLKTIKTVLSKSNIYKN